MNKEFKDFLRSGFKTLKQYRMKITHDLIEEALHRVVNRLSYLNPELSEDEIIALKEIEKSLSDASDKIRKEYEEVN